MICRLTCCALLLLAGRVCAEEADSGSAETAAAAKTCTKCSHGADGACTACEKSLTALEEPCDSTACECKCAAGDKACGDKTCSDGTCSHSDTVCATGNVSVTLDDGVLQASTLTLNNVLGDLTPYTLELRPASKYPGQIMSIEEVRASERRLLASSLFKTDVARPLDESKPSQDQELLRQKLAQRDELQREIDELCEATQSWQQIVVRMKVMEVNLTKMRELGIDFQEFGANGFQVSNIESCASKCCSEKCIAEKCNAENTSTEKCTVEKCAHCECSDGKCCTDKSNCQACSHGAGDSGFASFIEALEQNNVAKTLTRPTVMTVSGRPASIQVGGEVPIPAPPGSQSTCSFIDFGTKIDVLAVAQGDNKVRLEICSRISELCDDRSVQVDGNKIPSLRSSECDTAFELEYGQTVAMSGLISRRTEASKTEEGISEETCEVMQVLLVTPEVVR